LAVAAAGQALKNPAPPPHPTRGGRRRGGGGAIAAGGGRDKTQFRRQLRAIAAE